MLPRRVGRRAVVWANRPFRRLGSGRGVRFTVQVTDAGGASAVRQLVINVVQSGP